MQVTASEPDWQARQAVARLRGVARFFKLDGPIGIGDTLRCERPEGSVLLGGCNCKATYLPARDRRNVARMCRRPLCVQPLVVAMLLGVAAAAWGAPADDSFTAEFVCKGVPDRVWKY